MARTFRAGDVVKHGPSGETWTLATDEENGDVQWMGWPEGWAKAKDCTLVEAATDEARRKVLEEVGGRPHYTDSGRLDSRHVTARRQLEDLNQAYIGAGI
jgi:hypothetical protein